jgi:hypothetical protein
MSDEELVKRLRSWAKDIQAGSTAIYAMDLDLKNAATSIEALTAKNEMLGREVNIARYGQPDFAWSVHVQVMDDLNAKLAKAVEALREVAGECGCSTARAIIAEIEGEKP